jgi:hypothetical protein
VQGEAIFVGIEGNRANAQFVRRTENADGDLAAVGNEEFANGLKGFLRHALWFLGEGYPSPGVLLVSLYPKWPRVIRLHTSLKRQRRRDEKEGRREEG